MNRIALLRKEKHLNQVGLAMKLNISQYMVSAYETGRHQPPMDILTELADFFNVSVDYLIGRSDVRLSAEKLLNSTLSEKETKLLDLFRTLSPEKQEQSLGALFALSKANL